MFSPDLEEVRLKYFSQRDSAADAETIALTVASSVPAPDRSYESPFDSPHPIRQVGKQQYTEFRATTEELGRGSLPWSEVEYGFIVVASGIIKCKHAYRRYLKSSPSESYDKPRLKKALLSPRTIAFFLKISGISGVENREYETFFNFRDTHNDEDYDEFTFNPTDCFFEANPLLLSVAEEEAACKRYELIKAGIDNSEFGTCTAREFIPTFWRRTVEACDVASLLDEPERVDETCELPSDRTY
jgi:hypothetical protein